MKKLTFTVNDRDVEGVVAYARGTLWVHMNGDTFTFDAPKREGRRGRGGATLAQPGEVNAPMPGKIIKIFASPGEKVTAGQVLLVMEAMKMEYTLKAQAEGTVAEVNCEAGQQVSLGQSLIKLDVV